MKILHIESGRNLHGGPQQVVYLLKGLAERGGDNVLVCPAGAPLAAQFAGTSVEIRQVAGGGQFDLAFLFRLLGVLRRERPDLVHLHGGSAANTLGAIAARLAGIPCVLSRRVDRRPSGATRVLLYPLYARVICISAAIEQVLQSAGIDPRKLRRVLDGVPVAAWQKPADRAEFLAEFALPPDAVTVAIAGQFVPRKGHASLLRALQLGDFPANLRVIFFGSGALEQQLRDDVSALGLGGVVQFAGFRTDLPRWLGCVDILAHPAYAEGLGVALLQASSAGVPIVACAAGGIPEAVKDGVNGLLVPPRDDAALAGALARLIADPQFRRELGAKGRALAEREFSADAMVEGNLATYRELLDV